MVSSTLAPLYTVFGLKLGCSGAAAPIGEEVLENGEIFCSSIRPSVHPSVRPSIRPLVRWSVRPSVRPFVRPLVRPRSLLIFGVYSC